MITFSDHYGASTCAANSENGINLVSDGKTIALNWEHVGYIVPRFEVTQLQVHRQEQQVTLGGWRRYTPTVQCLEFTIRSRGPVQKVFGGELKKLFLNAHDLSVEQLLALAYQKVESREDKESELG